MEKGKKELIALIEKFQPLDKNLLAEINLDLRAVEIKKGDFFVSEGEPVEKIALVLSGLCRTYYLDAEGKEYTKYFQAPGVIAAPYAELILGVPARCYIQAIVDSELLLINYSDITKLYQQNMAFQHFGRKVAEHFFAEKDQREYELLQFSAEQRYEAFLEKYGDIALSIPKYQVASYLGITPVAFSRILAKRKAG